MLRANGEEIIFKIKLAATAKIIFVNGPAKATRAMSFLPSLRLNGSIGTGFAAPKITGEPEKIRRSGRRMLIKGSIWLWGLSVKRPESLAVGSPSLSATNPCATSCKMAEKSKMTKPIIISILFRLCFYDIILYISIKI